MLVFEPNYFIKETVRYFLHPRGIMKKSYYSSKGVVD